MMKFYRGILLSIFFISVHSSSAQDSNSVHPAMKINGYMPLEFSLSNFYGDEIGDQFQNEIGITAQAKVHSTAVTLPFSLALLGNDFIDNAKKKQVGDLLGDQNAFEFTYEWNAKFSWIQDSFLFHKPTLYSIDYSSGNFISAKFTEGVFNTIFYGNAYYAGETADFSGTKFYDFVYDRIGFSAQKKIQHTNSNWQAGAKISLLTIRSAMNLDLQRGTLFTEQNGEYLDAGYDFEFSQSDSSNHGRLQVDGLGTSLDLQLSWLNNSRSTQLTFYVTNLGVVEWNKQTRTFSSDSSIHFEGIQINDLISFDSSSFIHYNVDSLLKNTGTNEKRSSRAFMLPVSFSFLYQHSLSRKMLLNAGISYCPYSDLIPMVFVKPQWMLSPSVQIAAVASAGGDSRYALGADALFTIKKQFRIIFGSDNFLGLFIPKQTTSSSLFLQAAFQF